MINVRELLNLEPNQILNGFPKQMILLFEDGTVLETTNKKTYYSRYFWEILKLYPNTRIMPRHHVEIVLNGKPMHSSTHAILAGNISKDVIKTYDLRNPILREPINKLIYECTNRVHNEVVKSAEEYVAPIDIIDCVNFIETPQIQQALADVNGHHESISKLYKSIDHAIYNNPELKRNALAQAVRAKMVNFNQVCQCVGVRGFPTEVDDWIMKHPIMSNYAKGMFKLYDIVSDSRGAAKALYNAEAPLQDAEYFARRLQLLSMVVEKIDHTVPDCGTTRYVNWLVKGPQFDENGVKIYNGDLPYMEGKYYLDETTNQLRTIEGDNPNLHGKYIRMRSVVFCKHPNPHYVCPTCFGELAMNVSAYANLGHLCSATMTQQTSQSVLSTKHLVMSGVGTPINLTPLLAKYFSLGKNKTSYHLLPHIARENSVLVIARDDAAGLTDMLKLQDLEDVQPPRVSSIHDIEIQVQLDNGTTWREVLTIGQPSQKAFMTMNFLEYIRTHGWGIDEQNNYLFTLEDWDAKDPIFQVLDMEYSFSEHSHQIAGMIESSMKNISDREKPDSPVSTLQELFTLVNSKLNVNIAALEVIIYATMVSSSGRYDMGRNSPDAVLGVAKQLIFHRSLGSAYAYQDQHRLITSAESFFPDFRPDSVFDVFIAPKEVLEQYRK